MNGLDFLNLVIGLIFVYLIYSIAASTVWEILVNITHLRGNMLLNWILENFGELVYNDKKKKRKSKIIEHPLIKGMLKKSQKKPTYIPSEIFTDALLDLIVNSDSKDNDGPPSIIDINVLKPVLEKTQLLSKGLKRVFLQYLADASGSLQQLKDKIGNWYDEAQARLIGSYKKSLQLWIFLISIILVGATNADTIKIGTYLYDNPDARNAIANKVDLLVQDSAVIGNISRIDTSLIDSVAKKTQQEILDKIDDNINTLKELNQELSEAGIPIGWSKEDFKSYDIWDVLKKTGGLLLTVFAVSLGAPFWFDILSKLANLRSSGDKPKPLTEKQKEKK